ncbi:MAG: hypothetical protein FWB91_10285 [Defluviitaleaceae bacterium]|nr:hypothetical protein [Defluviitaleaceae bacterium]
MDRGHFDMCINYGNRFGPFEREEEIDNNRFRRRFHPLYYRFHRHFPFRRRFPMHWW